MIVFLAAMLSIILLAWNTDDAFHGFVMSRNWAEGKGLVYNLGERVNASTMPLNTILQGIMYFICGDIPYGAIYLGIAESGIAICLILSKLCFTRTQIFMVLLVWSSKSVISFSTSGLENSILFLLAVMYLILYYQKDVFEKSDLFMIALLMSGIAFSRMDAVLIFIPVSLYIYFVKRNKNISFKDAVKIGVIGLMPFIIWELFSIVYYGFPFPNTAYAKLGTGYPVSGYWIRGISYLIATASEDLLIIGIQIIYLVWAFKTKRAKHICVAAGIFIYNLFLINVGGDFMLGRHLTLPGIVSLCGVVILLKTEVKFAEYLVLGAAAATLISTSSGGLLSKNVLWPSAGGIMHTNGVADERAFYYPYTSLLSRMNVLPAYGSPWSSAEIQAVENSDAKGMVINWAPGMLRYHYARDKMIEDKHALGDAFLTKLNAVDEGEFWRVGHMYRSIPDGYNETLITGENKLIDPYLHEYYEHLSLIIKGDLFSRERLKTIVKMNLGGYDYLLDHYQKMELLIDNGTEYNESSFAFELSEFNHSVSRTFELGEDRQIKKLVFRPITWNSGYKDEEQLHVSITEDKREIFGTDIRMNDLPDNQEVEVHVPYLALQGKRPYEIKFSINSKEAFSGKTAIMCYQKSMGEEADKNNEAAEIEIGFKIYGE